MIYYVEDDQNVRDLVVYTLNQNSIPAEGISGAEQFWEKCGKQLPDMVMLDIMLPKEDGLSILKKLRSSTKTTSIPIMMVTAKGTEFDKVLGLDSGADDYITKPFSMVELVARVKALIRRSDRKEQKEELNYSSVTLNIKKHTVTVNGNPALLTLKEFELLRTLLENQGIVFTREQLLSSVWGYDYEGGTRTVDVHVQTLRQKLSDNAEIIETVRGVGYRIGG